MSAVKVFFTKNGTIIAESTYDSSTKCFTLKNPLMLTPNGLMSMLDTVQEKTIELAEDNLIFPGAKTPVTDLLNAYNKQFGSGIVLANLGSLA